MSFQRPRRNSSKIASFSTAMKIGAVVGSVAGAARLPTYSFERLFYWRHCRASFRTAWHYPRQSLQHCPRRTQRWRGELSLGAHGDSLDRYVLTNNRGLICRHSFNLPI